MGVRHGSSASRREHQDGGSLDRELCRKCMQTALCPRNRCLRGEMACRQVTFEACLPKRRTPASDHMLN